MTSQDKLAQVSVYLCTTNAMVDAVLHAAAAATTAVLTASKPAELGESQLPAAALIPWSPKLQATDLTRFERLVITLEADALSPTERLRVAQLLAQVAAQGTVLVFGPDSVTLAGRQAAAAPHASVIPNTQISTVLDEGSLQPQPEAQVERLVVLDGVLCGCYSAALHEFGVQGAGSALVATFHRRAAGDPVTATIDVLTDGMGQRW